MIIKIHDNKIKMKLPIEPIKSMLNGSVAIPESDMMEYKIQIHNHCMSKYIETICSFMNGTRKGGYLVFGVSDNLQMKGLNKSKNYDNYILKFDNIIHQNIIYGVDINGEMIQLNNANLRIEYYYNHKNDLYIIVDVTNPNNDITYQLRDGSIYYRLNASNYLNKHELLYSQQMVDNKIKLKVKDYQQIIDNNLKVYTIEFEKQKKEKEMLLNKLDEQKQLMKEKEMQYRELVDLHEQKRRLSICELLYMMF
jgi:hypothetical protein